MAMLTDDAPFKAALPCLLLAPASFAVQRRHPRHWPRHQNRHMPVTCPGRSLHTYACN